MATSYRHGVVSPPKYRRSTMDIYQSLETGQYTARTSALDRKWVHRSLGDLTSESDLQLSYPRLTSKFYQDLYKKYPRVFHRRQEARDAGRKLFNPKPHVRFEDDFVDDMSLKSARSERPTTNWDREVGYYKNFRSRECFTSAEPSETGSVLSVKERLHLNSQTLNRLLNEKSPLRKRFTKDSNGQLQYDSGTENENSGRDTLPNRTRLRFRNRKVLQRKVDNKQNGAIDGQLGELRKPKSYSREYMRRSRTVSPTNSKHRHVDVESLIANADLEINTLLEKISMKMASPESPPDSAIDVDTPSVRSLATAERGSNLDLQCPVAKESSVILKDCDSLVKPVDSGVEYRNGADCNVLNIRVQTKDGNDGTEAEISDPLKDPDNILLLKEYGTDIDDMWLGNKAKKEGRDSSGQIITGYEFLLEKEEKPNNVTQATDIDTETSQDLIHLCTQSDKLAGKGQGLLQLCETDSKVFDENGDRLVHAKEKTDTLTCSEYSQSDLFPCNKTERTTASLNFNSNTLSNGDMNSENVVALVKDQQVTVLSDVSQDKNYQADDEADVIDDIIVSRIQLCESQNVQKMPLHRDSDVDSGIGQSGTDTRSPHPVPPPRGRSRQRGSAAKTQPVKADHNILPLRSEVDSCILDEVNLTQMSYDPFHGHHRRGGIPSEETDDTDPRKETVTVTAEEQKVSEKYRRKRSPSPYVLKASRQASPRLRAQSAPLYYTGELNLHVVDISLSNDSLSDLSSNVSSTYNNIANSGIDTFISSKFHSSESVQTNISCQRNRQSSSPIQSCNVQQSGIVTSNLTNGQSNADSKLVSSSPIEQRKSSSSTYSVTSVSSADTENTLHDIHVSTVMNGIKQKEMENGNKISNGVVINEDTLTSSRNMDLESKSDVNNTALTHNYNYSHVETVQGNGEKVPSTDYTEKNKKETNVDGKYSKQSESLEQNPYLANQKVETESEIQLVQHKPETEVQVVEGSNASSSLDQDLQLHSAKKIKIPKPKLDTQVSVESKESFESVDLSETEVIHQEVRAREVRRIYKPSATSPRVCENKTNMRNIFKHKGRYSPGHQKHLESSENEDDGAETAVGRLPSRSLTPHHTAVVNEKTDENDDELMKSANNPVYFAKPVTLYSKVSDHPHNEQQKEHKSNLRAELNLSKYKIKMDKKIDSDIAADQNIDSSSQSCGSQWSRDSQKSKDSLRSSDSPRSQDNTKQHDSPRSYGSAKSSDSSRLHEREAEKTRVSITKLPGKQQSKDKKIKSASDEGEIVVLQSNLQKTKGMSASKGSLLDKVGGIKTATKGKLKAMRKAMSLERGIDQVGTDPHGQNVREEGTSGAKGGHSFFHKMKKAPSLKSISAFFGRKKKKGKFTVEDIEASTSGTPPSVSVDSSGSLSSVKRKQWASCHTLSSADAPDDNRPIGKLQKMNPDGTQIVELIRPPNGPLGFFIAQGNSKYKQGIFVSRFSKDGPEKLSGLLGVGDEILEVNRHLVHDLSLDAVYKLMGSSQIITLKIFPLIARKDF